MQPAALMREIGEIALDAREKLPSPCISVCRMHPASGLCEGCYRSIDEIAGWSRMGDEGKRMVWRAILARVEAAHPVGSP